MNPEHPTAATKALVRLISADNVALVERWATALRGAGGFYAALDDDGLRALAAGTISLLRHAIDNGGQLPPAATRRYVDPPPYRHQPLDQFVLAGLKVDRALRDYLTEQATDAAAAAHAMRIAEPVLAGAIMDVVRLRQRRLGAGQLVADLGKLFSRARNARRAFDAACDRLAQAFDLELCVLLAFDPEMVALAGAGAAFADLGIGGIQTDTRDSWSWLEDAEDDRVHIFVVGHRNGVERALRRAGFGFLATQSLVTHSRQVGALLFPLRSRSDLKPYFREHIESIAPLLAGQIGYVQQSGALERADAAIDDLFDASPNMMVELDRLGRITRTNDRFRREIGMPGDVVGMPLTWLVHPAWAERYTNLWARLQHATRVEMARLDLIGADSQRRALALEAHWIHDESGQRQTCLVALWNVTEQVTRAEAAQARIDELSSFAHHVAHDLQAPLRTIAAFTATLADELPESADPELRDAAERAQDGAERAGDLVQGLLRFAHGTRSDGASRVVTLNTLVDDVRAKLAADLDASSGRLVVTRDASRLLGDEVTLSTLLVNLVGNALRYAGCAHPRVEVGVEVVEPGWAHLFVRDNGPGVAPEDQERIFRPFIRGQGSGSGGPPGTGLGLAIVSRIARAHGGHVRLESTPGEGSTFLVRLPTP